MTKRKNVVMEKLTEGAHEAILMGKAASIYDPEFHPQNYVSESRKGLHKCHILLNWNITTHRFFCWKNKHPELMDAYFIGQMAFQVYWIDYLKEHLVMDFRSVFNQRGWEKIMQYGELNTKDRMIYVTNLHKKKTIKEKNKAILDGLCNQLITLNEAHVLQSLIEKQSKLTDVAELLDKVKQIEEEYGKK